jgi:hypothetical protein
MNPRILVYLLIWLPLAATASTFTFQRPSDWPAGVITQNGAAKVTRFSSPDESIHFTVVEVSPLRTPQNLDSAVRGHIAGLSKNGYQHQSTQASTLDGRPAQRLIGTCRAEGTSEVYFCENYIVPMQEACAIFSALVADDTNGRNMAADLFNHVRLASPATDFSESDGEPMSSTYKLWERIGFFAGCGLVGLYLLRRFFRG